MPNLVFMTLPSGFRPAFRADLVARVRSELQSGLYRADPEVIADAMLAGDRWPRDIAQEGSLARKRFPSGRWR